MLPALGNAFYLPGVAPTSYDKDQRVPLYVNRLTPTFSDKDSQVHSMFSYDYYYPKFHFCQPEGGPQSVRESLGSIIFGDRIMTSPFELHMAKDETCKALCKSKFDADSAEFINQQIIAAYNLNWLIDGLPAAQINVDDATKEEFYSPGFLLGEQSEEGKPILFNHYNIVIEYHRVAGYTGSAEPKYRVVGVLVVPESLADTKINDDGSVQCGFEGGPLSLKEDGETEVPWTYSVVWKESDTVWATRWDKYLHVYDPNVHWYSLIYSSIFVIVLVAFVTTILVRTLRKDIARYNRLDAIDLDDLNDTSVEDGIAEDSGWKLVHGDVFRAPSRPMLLAVLTGTGAQLFAMTAITVVFAMFGLLSPSHRGMLSTTIIILYTFLGSVGGYTAARVYKSFGGEEWKKLIIMTPLLIPGIAFAVFFILNFFVWIKGSSGAVPFTTMLIVVAIWFLISVPLSVVGSWVGFRRDVSLFSYHPLSLLYQHHTNITIYPGLRRTNKNKPNPPSNPSRNRRPPPHPFNPNHRPPPLRSHFRRALLHYDIHLDQQDLLHVRLPLHLFLLDAPHHRRCDNPPGLLPALCRGLQVAVEEFLRSGYDGWICLFERLDFLG